MWPWILSSVPDPLRAFDLVRVPLDELHRWLEERGLVAVEHSVDWGDRWDLVEVRDENDGGSA